MKHLKIFENFINEMQEFGVKNSLISKSFDFAIDIRNSTRDEQLSAIREFQKFAEMRAYVQEYLLGEQKGRTDGKPNAWIIRVSTDFGDICISYLIVTTSDWSHYNDKFITLKEFLSVGLPGVPEYIHMKTDINKYNL